jgi:hypothetical protein
MSFRDALPIRPPQALCPALLFFLLCAQASVCLQKRELAGRAAPVTASRVADFPLPLLLLEAFRPLPALPFTARSVSVPAAASGPVLRAD